MTKKPNFAVFLFVTIAFFTSVNAQNDNSEVFVIDLGNSDGKITVSNPVNISNSPGYDNQPSFGIGGKSVLFTSARNGKNPDIYEYVLASMTLNQITDSIESEYTPRVQDENTITFVREGEGQEMSVFAFDRASKAIAYALKNKEPVAYYDWNSVGGALVWIRYASMAHYVHPSKNTNIFVTDQVLPSTPHNIPGTLKFSFLHRQGNDEVWIKEYDPETRTVRPIVQPKDEKVDYCWMPDGSILMGSGTKLYRYHEKADMEWKMLADLSEFGLKKITRLAASKDGKKIAVVSNQ